MDRAPANALAPTAADAAARRPIAQLEMLEILSSLGSSLGSNDGESGQILQSLRIHLRQLLPLNLVAFYLVDPETAEFTLADCDPPELAANVQQAVDGAISEGTFAWALRQNRPLFTRGDAPGSTLVLHSIATPSRALGMFAGLVRDLRIHESDMGMRLLSVILSQGAHAIENATLHRRILGQNAELERMVRERTAQLEVALKAAQESAMVKSRFLANMSHEIRTPMNGILGLTELLETSELNDEQRADLRTLRECGQNLLAILSDILDYSKIEAGKLVLEHEPFDLHHVLNDTLRLMRPLAHNKGLQLNLDIDPAVPVVVLGDQTRLRQVLLNLIGNGIKFTEHGAISVELRPVRASAPIAASPMLLHFEVGDTGIGIHPEVLDLLFKPFSQADASTTRVFGGTGLGLAISKSLCHLMGGDIWATSQAGAGSQFAFEIPVELPRPGQHGPESMGMPAAFDAALAEMRPLRILVIDDSSMNQLVACRMLMKLGYTPVTATGGREGVDQATQHEFDLVLIDLQMPDLDGYGVLQAIREHCAGGHRPRLVAMTANALREDREKCTEAGFDDFLAKPFSSRDIKSVLLDTTVTSPARS